MIDKKQNIEKMIIKTTKDLAKKLTEKIGGRHYIYEIGNMRYEICEFNDGKGWCLNEYKAIKPSPNFPKGWKYIDAYGYDGLLLRECKDMILGYWNRGEIKED